MKKFLIIVLLWFVPTLAYAANVNIDGLSAASSVAGADLFECEQSSINHKCTATQAAAFIYGLATGDCTISGIGAIVCTKTNGVAFGALATITPGTGVATLLANPSSGTGAPLGGTAPTMSSPTINTAATFGFITGSTQCLHVNTSGVLSGTGSDCGAGGGAVSSVTAGCGLTISPTTGAVVASVNVTTTNNTGITDTITATACGTITTENNASSIAVSITTAGFGTGNYFTVKNLGAGVATYTPTSGTIDGAATLVCKQNQSADLYFDGTNYKTLANSCGATLTIASGTSALGIGAITSAACATVVTTAGTGIATTDVVTASFNGDPTAVTGYVPLTTGMLTIIAYPTSGNVNFKVCNNTSASITPGAITLNWRVVR